MNQDMTARQIIDLLLQKHSGDVCVTECKDGPTQYGRKAAQRMDLWVMPKSWANPEIAGYEIKVARSDFLRDEKWKNYLELCNRFYFVCPWGLIDPRELPEQAGLMWCSKNLTRIYTKKKAPDRDVEIPERVFRYVLMARASIDVPRGNELDWESWLENEERDKWVGHEIASKISRRVKREVGDLKSENRKLRNENEQLQGIKQFLDEGGIDIGRHWYRRNLRDQIVKESGLMAEIERLRGQIDRTLTVADNESKAVNE